MERCSSNQGIPLTELPLEVVDHILSFTDVPKHDTQKEVKAAAHKLARLSSVCRDFDALLVPRLNKLKRKSALIAQYNSYNQHHNPGLHGGPPQLVCAINCFNRSNAQAKKAEIEKDIVDIVCLMPQSLVCTQFVGGTVRPAPIFAVICFDLNIPDRVIESLAKLGATFDITYMKPGKKNASLMKHFANDIKMDRNRLVNSQNTLSTEERKRRESEIESMEQRYQLMQRLQNTYSSSQKSSNSTGAPIRKTAQQ